MTNYIDLRPTLTFLADLSRNNNKAWFDSHRLAYDAARRTFEQLVEDLIDEFRASDHLEDVTAKDCIARIYRDVRFSKDKSPYKTNFAAHVAPGGWRSTVLGYYVSIAPHGQSLVAGGLHDPTPAQLDRFRQAIDRDPAPFKKVTGAKAFVDTFGAVEGERLKTAPKGYDREHPEIALLQLKQILAMHALSDEEVLAPDFVDQVITVCRAMKPFLDYLNRLLR
jgi:uncharacterized protein (TIGR02453 family)